MTGDLFGLVWLVVLLAGNAFFVAAEFAVLSARRSQIEPRAEAGSKRARTALYAMEHVSQMLAIFAYTMHMWELYACWSWFRRFTAASLVEFHGYDSGGDRVNSTAGLITFFVVSSGAIGCIAGGIAGGMSGGG